MLDRVCDEFRCLPSQAERELDTNYEAVMDVLQVRDYARAKAAYDNAANLTPESRRALMQEPLVQLVKATEFELAQAEIDGRDV